MRCIHSAPLCSAPLLSSPLPVHSCCMIVSVQVTVHTDSCSVRTKMWVKLTIVFRMTTKAKLKIPGKINTGSHIYSRENLSDKRMIKALHTHAKMLFISCETQHLVVLFISMNKSSKTRTVLIRCIYSLVHLYSTSSPFLIFVCTPLRLLAQCNVGLTCRQQTNTVTLRFHEKIINKITNL